MSICNLAEAQRPFYASRPHQKLLPRFRTNEAENELGNRVGEDSTDDNNKLPAEVSNIKMCCFLL